MGKGTYSDIPRHVNATTRILRMRLMDQSAPPIQHPFDRLAVESVLYQIFLVTVGSWSNPLELDYRFDAAFWLQAEKLLARSTGFPDVPAISNSPVLGVPLALFKLVLSVKQLWQSPLRYDEETLADLKAELAVWERFIADQDASSTEHCKQDDPIYRDATHLYVLVASLLAGQLSEQSLGETQLPGPAPQGSWQIQRAMKILRDHENDDDWAGCYIGNWPVYTLGFFVSSPEDVETVRRDLQRGWNSMRFSQLERFRDDLERTWSQRRVP
jgi:hypothetical protein